MSIDDGGLQKRLLQAFNMEAEERLHALGAQLIALEEKLREGGSAIDDPASRQLVENIHRELHSLKGASRTVGFPDIERVCQDAESVLSAVKRGDIEPTASSFDVLHAVVALVEHLVRTVDGGRDEDAAERVDGLLVALRALERGEQVAFRRERMATGTTARQQAAQDDEANTAMPVATSPAAAGETPKDDADKPAQQAERRSTDWQSLSDTIRLPTEEMSAMRAMAEDLQAAQIALSRRLRALRDTMESMQRLDTLWTEAMYEQGSQAAASPRRVDADEAPVLVRGDAMNTFLDACRDDLSNVSSALNHLWYDLDRDGRELEKNVGELTQAMKQALLMPMESLIARFPLTVRDLARQQGKEAVCEMEGADITLDRRILEILNDPFIHALRNAVDHGIETPDERRAAGKSEHGVVRIRIERQGSGMVRIEIADDGRGIDSDALRARAVDAGILDAQRAESLTRDETLGLVFLSDLSTAREVSTLSGRGLGMAIVRGKVEQAGGHVGVSSVKGKGTVLTIVVPVTLTTFNGVVVSAAGRHFVAPMDNMVRLVLADSSMVTETGGQKLLADGDDALPMASLAEVLSLPKRESDEPGVRTVLVARSGEDMAAIVVDAVLEEQEVMLKDLGPQLKRVRHIAGVATLGTGELAPVLLMGDVVSAIVRPGAPRARPAMP
ncbi:MAG: chemotaxis protein CheA, partial [Oceanidesulfovibrio sp.]